MMENREGGGGDGTQWTPLLPSVLPWSSGTPSMTSQVVHFTGTPSMTSPVVHFSGTPTMTSQAVHFTGPPTMTSQVVNFTGTPTMTSQVINFSRPPTMTSQFTGTPTMTSQFTGTPSMTSQFTATPTMTSQMADQLANYGFVTPCESMTSSLPYRPLFPPKRKCPLAWDEIPPPKMHVTDEHMACRMKGLQISSAQPNLLTQQQQQNHNDDVTLVVCDEIRQLRMPDNILPAELLAKLERPSKALVVWKPPEQRAAEILQQTLKIAKEKEEKKKKKEMEEMVCSSSVYSVQPNDQKVSSPSVYSLQPHPTLPNFSVDAYNNNNTLFEAPVQQQPRSSSDVEDMALDIDV